MANLLDIRRRIKSVKNTQQITKAMKMVSAAKLKRAQERAVSARPFAVKMAEVLTDLASQAGEDFTHPLMDARGDQRYLLVLVTADKGLAGAFNANLTKAALAFMREHEGQTIEVLAVGRKGRDFFRRRKLKIAHEFAGVVGETALDRARDLAHTVGSDFKATWQERGFNPQPDPPADPTKVTTTAAATA